MPTPRQRLDEFADLFAPTIKTAFIAAIQDVTDNAILADVVRAVELGDFERAFRALGFSEAALRPLTAAVERAFEEGGVLTGETFPKYLNTSNGRAIFRFDVRNSRAEKWLRENSSSLVTQITEDARQNVRNTLVVGMEAGRNPRNVALDIVGRIDRTARHRVGGIVGLTTQQEAWARNTRRMLVELDPTYFKRELRDKRFDSIVARAIRDDKPLMTETIDRLITRYKDNALRYRGENIGRTEAIQALNASEFEAIKQAVALGAVNENSSQREWDDVGDSRTRHSHRLMRGQRVGVDEPFVSPLSGARMMYPGDKSLGAPGSETIHCRCRFKMVIDWFDGVK
jgi:hypothetical protein